MSSPLAFDWSTPAEAQTKPCRVSAITSGGRARTIRRLSRRITSRRRASSSAASVIGLVRRLDPVEMHNTAFDLRHRFLSDDDVAFL